MIPILNLIRWKNLIIIALVQCLIKYALLDPFIVSHGVTITLNTLGFSILVAATLCIAAAGNIINDLYDIETDTVNKPDKVIIGKHISEKLAFNLFIILNVIGVGLGFYLSNSIGKNPFAIIFIIISASLYIYSSYLKQITLVGNLVISAVVAMSILVVGIFELLPVLTPENRDIQIAFLEIIRDYAIFAFLINLLRELIKDIEDIDGDHKAGMRTLPIVLGRDRATKIAFVFALVILINVVYYVVTYLFKQTLAVGYFLALVIAPLLYVAIKTYSAEQKSQYKHISTVLKLVMVTGILSLLLYKYILL